MHKQTNIRHLSATTHASSELAPRRAAPSGVPSGSSAAPESCVTRATGPQAHSCACAPSVSIAAAGRQEVETGSKVASGEKDSSTGTRQEFRATAPCGECGRRSCLTC